MKTKNKYRRNELIPNYCKLKGIRLQDLSEMVGYKTTSFLGQIIMGHRYAPIDLALKLEEITEGFIPAHLMIRPSRLKELATIRRNKLAPPKYGVKEINEEDDQ